MFLIARAIRRPTRGEPAAGARGRRRPLRDAHPGRRARRGARGGDRALRRSPGRARSAARTCVRIAPTLVAVGAVLVAAVAALVARGPNASLGSRSGTFDALRPGEVPEWFAYLLGGLVLYVALIPAAASVVVIARGIRRRAPEPERLFAVDRASDHRGPAADASPSSAPRSTSTGARPSTSDTSSTSFPCCSSASRSGSARGSRVRGCSRRSPPAAVRHSRSSSHRPVRVQRGLPVAVAPSLARAVRLEGRARTRGRGIRGDRSRALAEVPDRARAAPLARGGRLDDARRGAHGRRQLRICRRCPRGRSPGGPRTGSTAPFRRARRSPSSGARSRGARSPRASATGSWSPRCSTRASGDVYRTGPETYYENVLPTVPVIARPGSGRLERAGGAPLEARYVLVTCRWPVVGRVVATAPYGALQLVEAIRAAATRAARALSGRRTVMTPSRHREPAGAGRVDPVATPPPFGRSGCPRCGSRRSSASRRCVRAALTLRVPGPWILPDELLYSELAKSIADGSRPAIRGVAGLRLGRGLPDADRSRLDALRRPGLGVPRGARDQRARHVARRRPGVSPRAPLRRAEALLRRRRDGRPRAVDDVHRCPHDGERVLPGVRACRPPRRARRATADARSPGARAARSRHPGVHADPGPRARGRVCAAPSSSTP